MKLTKRKALEITLQLWTWTVAEMRKPDCLDIMSLKHCWPGWERVGNMACRCPCCEYRNQRDGGCSICPIWGGTVTNCMSYGTPYDQAKNGDTAQVRLRGARDMVLLCRSRLRQMDAKRKR